MQAMFIMGVVFFIVATMHLGMNCFRMIRGFVDHANDPGGAVAYLGNLAPWDHVFKDTLYATQEIIGDGVAIYRCWVIWNRDWRIIILPLMLFIVSIISGYTVCGLYTSVNPADTVFDPRLTHWISTFYSVAVVQSTMTTGLMAYKIWKTDRRSASYRANAHESSLLPVLRILVESASLQLFVEIILLALYEANYNAQYILLEIVTPLVGITFTAITIRLALRMSGALDSTKSTGTHPTTLSGTQNAQITTIGSMPMRPIAINITHDVHLKQDVESGTYTHYRPHHHHRKASVPISSMSMEMDEGKEQVDADGDGRSMYTGTLASSKEKLSGRAEEDLEVVSRVHNLGDDQRLALQHVGELGYHHAI
ncbi:hypothetical protein EIP91_011146 [Steccherinum ochraceum]|uniref:Uncharacterized protein n=1 Tax=Steccherinum ochraceum TaxID=92696 RepID=A0A4R0RWU3_9APHY|nr:hypothetical protein EIP91_011146 [Steccherinum ochraceum]